MGTCGWLIDFRRAGDTATPVRSESFDYVVVASGAHHHVQLPELPGRELFSGMVLHANEVRAGMFAGRRVVVVGGGKSAMDLITRDMLIATGLYRLPRQLRPAHTLPFHLAHAGVMPRGYARAVRCGLIDPKIAAVQAYTDKGLRLMTGEEVTADVIVFAVGHQKVFPFLDSRVQVHDAAGRLRLYRGVVPPSTDRLGFVGFRQVFNNIMGVELTAQDTAGSASVPPACSFSGSRGVNGGHSCRLPAYPRRSASALGRDLDRSPIRHTGAAVRSRSLRCWARPIAPPPPRPGSA